MLLINFGWKMVMKNLNTALKLLFLSFMQWPLVLSSLFLSKKRWGSTATLPVIILWVYIRSPHWTSCLGSWAWLDILDMRVVWAHTRVWSLCAALSHCSGSKQGFTRDLAGIQQGSTALLISLSFCQEMARELHFLSKNLMANQWESSKKVPKWLIKASPLGIYQGFSRDRWLDFIHFWYGNTSCCPLSKTYIPGDTKKQSPPKFK